MGMFDNFSFDPRQSSVGQALTGGGNSALGGLGGMTIGSVLGSLLGPAGTIAGAAMGRSMGTEAGQGSPMAMTEVPSAPVGATTPIAGAPSQPQRSSLANEERNRAAQRAALPKNTEFTFNLEKNPFSKSQFSK